jgi:EpsI family protein
MRSPRFWLIVLLMSFTALVLHVRGDQDRVPPSRPLNQLPLTIGSRTAVDIEIPAEELQVLGRGDFLSRDYQPNRTIPARTPGDLAVIDLFIAYFPTQRTGQSIHSPQNCLPGAGWFFQSRGVAEWTSPDGKKYRVGDYVISNGSSTDEALYWYQLHGRSIPGDYEAKLYTIADSIRYGRTDEALVRIITPFVAGEDGTMAHNRALDFAKQIAPLLPAYVPN